MKTCWYDREKGKMMENTSYINRQDKYLANFIVGYYLVQALNLLVKLVIGNFTLWLFISRGILIFLLLFALKPMFQRKSGVFIWTEIVFAVLFSYTFLFRYASFSEYSSIVLNVFTVFIPMAIAAVSINDKSILVKRMYLFSWPIQVLLLYVLVTRSNFNYSMIGGYTLVFQALIILDHFTEKRKWYDLIACIVDLIVVFIYGSRGPIICIFSLIVIKILFSPSISQVRKMSLILLTCTLFGAIVVFYHNIIAGFITLTTRLGYSSRNLYLLLNGRITSDSGRNSIQRLYLEAVKNGPILGHGIAGGWLPNGVYPHNIFIELLLSFGPVLGLLVSAVILYLSYSAIICKNEGKRRVGHILLAYSVSLLISDTFLKSPMFFMLMGIGLQSIPFRFKFGNRVSTRRLRKVN